MPARFLTERMYQKLLEIIAAYERNTLNVQGRQPALPADHEEILTPETYIAITPAGGIAACIPPIGTGTDPDDIHSYFRPGKALCTIYRLIAINGIDVLVPLGVQKEVHNFMQVKLAGSLPFKITRDKPGTWWADGIALEVEECDTTTGTGTHIGTGTHGGGTPQQCDKGSCGDEGVPSTLVANITDKVGCFTSLPDTISFTCVNVTGGHVYEQLGTLDECGETQSWSIGTLPTSIPFEHRPALQGGGFGPQACEDGYTCSPYSAVFHINNFAGATATVTVVEM